MVTGYFDNSSKNKFNPDPTKEVRHGEPTYDEMMMGFLDYVSEAPPIAQLDPKTLDSYTGKYEVQPSIFATVMRDGNNLVVQIPLQPKLVFTPTSETRFFLANTDTDLVFVKNDKGEVVEAVIEGGRTIRAKRVKEVTAGGSGQ
jgi:hypothetical protein